MKNFIIFLLILSVLAINVGTVVGSKVVSVHPVAFFQAVVNDMPESYDVFKHLTDYYNESDSSTLKDKLLWIGNAALDSLAFPVTSTIWFFKACGAFWGNIGELFEFENSNLEGGDNDHGDTDDPNHAGGR